MVLHMTAETAQLLALQAMMRWFGLARVPLSDGGYSAAQLRFHDQVLQPLHR